jgi:hypothetical protein
MPDFVSELTSAFVQVLAWRSRPRGDELTWTFVQTRIDDLGFAEQPRCKKPIQEATHG